MNAMVGRSQRLSGYRHHEHELTHVEHTRHRLHQHGSWAHRIDWTRFPGYSHHSSYHFRSHTLERSALFGFRLGYMQQITGHTTAKREWLAEVFVFVFFILTWHDQVYVSVFYSRSGALFIRGRRGSTEIYMTSFG